MTGLEIAVLILGVIMVGGSFFITKGLSSSDVEEISKMSKAEVKTILEKELNETDKKIQNKLDSTMDDKYHTFEVKTDKETNEKIKQISEYSDTVLEAMNKSHDEVMFMYDMLNKKQETVTELTHKIDKMESALRALQSELEEKEKIIIEEREKNEAEALRQDQEFESLKEEFQKKLDMNYENSSEPEQKDRANENQAILKLSKEGYSEIEIAKKLGLGIGEVKLVLGLFNQ